MARGARSGSDTRSRTQSHLDLGFRRAQGGGGDAAAAASALEAAAPTPSASESARAGRALDSERLQKLIGDVVGKHILVPFDHWEYEDEDAQEEPREAVSVRITAWDAEGNVFKVGSLLPALHLCHFPSSSSMLCRRLHARALKMKTVLPNMSSQQRRC